MAPKSLFFINNLRNYYRQSQHINIEAIPTESVRLYLETNLVIKGVIDVPKFTEAKTILGSKPLPFLNYNNFSNDIPSCGINFLQYSRVSFSL